MTTVLDFARFKQDGRKIVVVTAYDVSSARLAAGSDVDAILVGDSVAMVVHGHTTTVDATVGMMALHTRAVARGAGGKLVIADLPFLSFRRGIPAAMRAVGALVKAGAHAVKLEGADGHEDVIHHIVESGVPVMGHLGLTPQSVNAFGGFHVQGRSDDDAARVTRQAHMLKELGCFALVLECIPAALAGRITAEVGLPTIGIGAGAATDGQVLVLHDLLGLSAGKRPRFVRTYADGSRLFTEALDAWADDVRMSRFPGPGETYS